MGKKEWYMGGGGENGATIMRRSFNTGDHKDAGPWLQDDQEGSQQCQQDLDKENQEIQDQTHKADYLQLWSWLYERWRRILFKTASRFLMCAEFLG